MPRTYSSKTEEINAKVIDIIIHQIIDDYYKKNPDMVAINTKIAELMITIRELDFSDDLYDEMRENIECLYNTTHPDEDEEDEDEEEEKICSYCGKYEDNLTYAEDYSVEQNVYIKEFCSNCLNGAISAGYYYDNDKMCYVCY